MPVAAADASALALDAAVDCIGAGLVSASGEVREARLPAGPGQVERLAPLIESLLAGARPGLIAVTTGPGSFTGVRAALALAHGMALGFGVPLVGVSVGEAIAAQWRAVPGWTLWTAIRARPGRVFLESAGGALAAALDALPEPPPMLALGGNAAEAVAERYAAEPGVRILLTGLAVPDAAGIVRAARARAKAAPPPWDAQPFYVDPPEARASARVRPEPR